MRVKLLTEVFTNTHNEAGAIIEVSDRVGAALLNAFHAIEVREGVEVPSDSVQDCADDQKSERPKRGRPSKKAK